MRWKKNGYEPASSLLTLRKSSSRPCVCCKRSDTDVLQQSLGNAFGSSVNRVPCAALPCSRMCGPKAMTEQPSALSLASVMLKAALPRCVNAPFALLSAPVRSSQPSNSPQRAGNRTGKAAPTPEAHLSTSSTRPCTAWSHMRSSFSFDPTSASA